jgi:hypothetical protein
LVEYQAASLGGRHSLLKPLDNLQAESLRIPDYGVTLFLQRDSFFSLFRSGDTDVGKKPVFDFSGRIYRRTIDLLLRIVGFIERGCQSFESGVSFRVSLDPLIHSERVLEVAI